MFVPRSRLTEVEIERDQWRRRAEVAPRRTTQYVFRRSPVWARLVAASWFVALGLLVGGSAIPRANDGPILREDYSGCIGKARYEHPIDGNQYQELVNALYRCDVYRVG